MATHRPLRIVVVDDNHDATDSLVWLLQLAGHEVVACYTGGYAIEKAGAESPDAILLDIKMPGLDGYEVARRIREQETCKDTLLVAMTGLADEAHRQQAVDAGFDHYLLKPFDLPAIHALLENHLRKQPSGLVTAGTREAANP